jgi:hypothetical protein
MIFRLLFTSALILQSACAGGPEVPDWQLNSAQAMQAFQRDYLVGDTAAAERDFDEVKTNLKRTGRADLLARAELARCAVRAAALEFDDCPAFEALRAGAPPEEVAYSDFLAGKGAHKGSDDPLARLVAAAVSLRNGTISPTEISRAVETASAQGWARPLLAWLGVQAKRAEDAGDREAAVRLRRRMDLISK